MSDRHHREAQRRARAAARRAAAPTPAPRARDTRGSHRGDTHEQAPSSASGTLVLPIESALAFDDEHGGSPSQVGMTDDDVAAWLDARGLPYRWNRPDESVHEGYLRSLGLR